MKRIKQIIEALRVVSNTPSAVIMKAINHVMLDATSNTSAYASSEEERTLVTNLLHAVVAVAVEIEKKAEASS